MAAKRVVEDGRSLRRLVAMRLDIAVSIDIVLPAREQRDPIEELERERRIAAFGDKATDAVRDLDMLERIVGALGDILIFDKPVHQFAPVAVGPFGRRKATHDAEQRFPQFLNPRSEKRGEGKGSFST